MPLNITKTYTDLNWNTSFTFLFICDSGQVSNSRGVWKEWSERDTQCSARSRVSSERVLILFLLIFIQPSKGSLSSSNEWGDEFNIESLEPEELVYRKDVLAYSKKESIFLSGLPREEKAGLSDCSERPVCPSHSGCWQTPQLPPRHLPWNSFVRAPQAQVPGDLVSGLLSDPKLMNTKAQSGSVHHWVARHHDTGRWRGSGPNH